MESKAEESWEPGILIHEINKLARVFLAGNWKIWQIGKFCSGKITLRSWLNELNCQNPAKFDLLAEFDHAN